MKQSNTPPRKLFHFSEFSDMEKRHINIPIFIPHEGCPNDCVFCNQRSITGSCEKADRDIHAEIESVLATVDKSNTDVEIAFFGGSFTGIDRNVMERLLSDAYAYITRGEAKSIRLSTRPDFIDGQILRILSKYGVEHIELGIQSMSDDVLCASRRGHTAEQTEKACRLIVESGFSLTGQMMIGLPLSTLEKEQYTAKRICELGADSARIYPCVVFYDTHLYDMALSGEYSPLSNDDAAFRSAKCMEIFEQNNVKLLRVGLQAGEGLSADKVFAGASHSAIGELALNELYLSKITVAVNEALEGRSIDCADVEILCATGELSKVSGQRKRNKLAVEGQLSDRGISVRKIVVRECAGLKGREIKININRTERNRCNEIKGS